MLIGYAGGLLAALAGVGGGLIYTPFFALWIPWLINAQWSAGLAVSASLIAIILTGSASALAHWRKGHVHRRYLPIMIPLLAIGASVGLWGSFHLESWLIMLMLAAIDVWVAFDLYRQKQAHTGTFHFPLYAAAPLIGYFSGSLGIAGGTMLMPLLRRHLPLVEAVATSALCGTIMVMVACMSNAFFHAGWLAQLLPQLPSLLACWLGIVATARYGARQAVAMHERYPEATIRKLLSIVFAVLASLLVLSIFSK